MSRAHRATPLLSRGDAIGVAGPGFALRKAKLEAGIAEIERMGYRPLRGKHLLASHGYLAGTDDQRGEDLRFLLAHPEVRAVWFARGGYGTARVLDRVPWSALRRHPKLLIGYSDLTALFNAAVQRAGLIALYGPVVTELGQPATYHPGSLRKLLAGESLELRVSRRQILAPGRATGTLLGGNLSVLTHLCGTRFMPDLRGSILFIEETGEQTYRIDRTLTQLRMAGALKGVAGVVIGAMLVPARKRFPADRPLLSMLREELLPLGVPVVSGLPAGHCANKRTLPLGGRAEIDAASGRVRFSLP